MNKKQERLTEAYEYIRKHKGIHTQTDLANAIGMTRPSLSAAMNGKEAYLTDSLFTKICAVYSDLSLEYLKTGNGSLLHNTTEPSDTAPMEKQMDALAYLTASVTNLAGTLSDALARLNIKEKEIDERIERLDSMLRLMSANVTLYDVAAESSHSSNEKTTATT